MYSGHFADTSYLRQIGVNEWFIWSQIVILQPFCRISVKQFDKWNWHMNQLLSAKMWDDNSVEELLQYSVDFVEVASCVDFPTRAMQQLCSWMI